MPGMELRQTARLQQTQRLVLSPSVQLSLELLQVPSLELEKLIETELRENPLLEIEQEEPAPEEGPDAQSDPQQAQQAEGREEGQSAEASEDEPRRADENEDHLEFLAGVDEGDSDGRSWSPEEPWRPELAGRTTLSDHLLEQIANLRPGPAVEAAARYVVYSLDNHGLLSIGRDDLAAGWDGDAGDLEKAVAMVQGLEPTGVGSFSVQDALGVQLAEEGRGPDSLEQRILRECFDDLLERQNARIARRLGASPHEVQEAIDFIRHLDPYPGSDFAPDSNSIIIPDVVIEKIEGRYVSIVNDSRFPTLRISERNRRILESPSTPPEERQYIREKYQRASFFLRSIDQRQQTVGRIAEFIAAYQKGYLDSGVEALKPLTLQQAAEALECNQSTISRAINGKYVQTPQGVVEMRYFFNHGLPESEEISTRTVKEELKRIVEEEDKSRPLSDEALANMLRARGFPVKRRTVANYRESLGILTGRQRKRY